VIRAPRLVEDAAPLVDALADLWLAVTRAGGAVGFLPDSPAAEIRARTVAVIDEVQGGREHLLVVDDETGLTGSVFLRRGRGPRKEHGAEVARLMVRPDAQGRGLGRALLGAAVARARDLGLEHLLLAVRGGTALPGFYAAQGWTEVGLFPGALRLGPGPDGLRDEHWFQLRLT
jgi:acetyltransferase